MNRLEIIFDVQRIGLNEVAENILYYLDYASLVNLKRTCRTIHSFITNTNVEIIKEVNKLNQEWKESNPKQIVLDAQGLVSCAKFFDEGRKVVVGIDHSLQVFNTSSQEDPAILSLCNENSLIKCVDVNDEEKIIATGSADGLLILWDAESGDQLMLKQLFGRIEAIKWKGSHFVTAHFGRAFDAGCISLRKYISPTDFRVIHSIYEDLFPIFCIDFSDKFLSALEWSGTYNNVHGGNVNIYRMKNLEPVANLSTVTGGYTYTNCRFFGSYLLTGGHDGVISIWEMPVHDDSAEPMLLRSFIAHNGIIVRLEVDSFLQRIVSRDITGEISVWDLSKYSEDAPLIDTDDLLLRKIDSMSRTVTCLSMEKRRLFLGSIGAFNIQDFWRSSSSPNKI